MIVITAPDDLKTFKRPSIFLGGAITGAPDWQSEAIQILEPFATCFNPRRPDGFVHPTHPEYRQQYKASAVGTQVPTCGGRSVVLDADRGFVHHHTIRDWLVVRDEFPP
jgi:hypothetical protein